jgi:hypothetical protein
MQNSQVPPCRCAFTGFTDVKGEKGMIPAINVGPCLLSKTNVQYPALGGGGGLFPPPAPSLGPPRHTHAHNQGGRRKELARSCRCRGGVPTSCPSSRTTCRHLAKPTRSSTKFPVPLGAPCLLFLCPSSIEPLVLVSAPPYSVSSKTNRKSSLPDSVCFRAYSEVGVRVQPLLPAVISCLFLTSRLQ